jgi:hypothetical protein
MRRHLLFPVSTTAPGHRDLVGKEAWNAACLAESTGAPWYCCDQYPTSCALVRLTLVDIWQFMPAWGGASQTQCMQPRGQHILVCLVTFLAGNLVKPLLALARSRWENDQPVI